ncbi:MAG: hypothetical protein QOH36_1562 [Actinomycetota bacterium]|nr:hypothetical protein [Actinomycetota bacterium]
MRTRITSLLVATAVVGATAGWVGITARPTPFSTPAAAGRDAGAVDGAVRAGLSRSPVSFVANQGRWDDAVSWVASGTEATAFFVDGGVRWALAGTDDGAGWAVDQTLVGGRESRPTASVTAPGVVSYFVDDRHDAGLPTATELTLAEAWPGVDVVWAGTGGHIEATYRLAPGADPGQVRVAWTGADALAVTDAGRLSVSTPVRTFEEDEPYAFQEVDGARVPVEVAFDLDGSAATYGFRLGSYDRTRPLVIDPTTLLYAGFLGGGSNDSAKAVAVDGDGNIYVTGQTSATSTTFPVTPGVFGTESGGGSDAFVAKFDPTGDTLVYAGFLGGTGTEIGQGIAVDGAGNASITGSTTSDGATFPLTGAFQPTAGGAGDAFVAKVNGTGTTLTFASFLGGSGRDTGDGIAVDGVEDVYITGKTGSGAATFPDTAGVFQAANAGGDDAFVAKVESDGSAIVYAGFLGGAGDEAGNGIAVDGAGNAFVTGETASTAATFPDTAGVFDGTPAGGSDAFVAEVNPTGSGLVYAGFLGGSGTDIGRGIALDGSGDAVIVGDTNSTAATFPSSGGVFQPANAGGFDAFFASIKPSGAVLNYAGFLGGSGSEFGAAIAVEDDGTTYLTGQTTSTAATFPDTPGGFQAENAGGTDAWVARVDDFGGSLGYASFLGGTGFDAGNGIAVDDSGNAVVAGISYSPAATFPVTPDLFGSADSGDSDALLGSVKPSGAVLNWANLLGGTSHDSGNGIAVDGAGNAYVTGQTSATTVTFPATPGAFQGESSAREDAFVAKFGPNGTPLLYVSFLGGTGNDSASGIAVDGAGNAYITGRTTSNNNTFPDTPGVFQATNGGASDAFVAKVNPTGTALLYAGFLGGSGADLGAGIAVDGAGNAYVTGQATSTAATFPDTPGVFQPAAGGGTDAFVAKVNPTGSTLVYAGFLGGSGNDAAGGIALDGAGNAYVVGDTDSSAATFPDTAGVFQPANAGGLDVFVAKVGPSGGNLVYAGFFGGAGNEEGRAITVDGAGNAYMVGATTSPAATFPDTPGVFQAANGGGFDAFVAKVGPSGGNLVYAGFLGGSGNEAGSGVAVDGSGNAYVTGRTTSTAATFPDTPGGFQADNAGDADAFVVEVGATGAALVYAGFLGGDRADGGSGIAVDAGGDAYITGQTSSRAATFPDTGGVGQAENAGGTDAFVAKVAGPFASPQCTQTVTGDVVGPLTVNAGQSLCVTNARVAGGIAVNAGGAVRVVNSSLSQGIVATGPVAFSVCGSQISGPPSIPGKGVMVTGATGTPRVGDPSSGCGLNRVAGDVTLNGNTVGLVLGSNIVSGNVTVNNNSGATVVRANTVYKTLACTGNVPAPTNGGQANSAAAKTGQCSAL